MIQNLNPITFRQFGTILPERGGRRERGSKLHDTVAPQEQAGEAALYRTESETSLRICSGKIVLSVSRDGKTFQNFYFDKSVHIRAKTLFALLPFMGTASVEMSGKKLPTHAGSLPLPNLRVDCGLHVDGIYTFFYQEREQGFLFPGESHPFFELTYVDKGVLHSVLNGQDLLLKQGDLEIYGPDQWHMQYADIGVAPSFVTITFDMNGADLSSLYGQTLAAPQQAVSLIEQMLHEQDQPDAYSNDVIIAQLSLLLLLLLREAASPRPAKLQPANSVQNENTIVRQAQIYISAHVREKLSVPLVAQQVDISSSYLTALFHKHLQIPPAEYIRRVKLQESKRMIREGNLNFTEIAAELQYSTVHHFSRQFKDKFGITPTEYAKSVR